MPGEIHHPVIVVGAGLCGLALAYRLERLGVHVVILDRARRVAEPWRRRHTQLRLNTHCRYSRLPGARLPRGAGAFADRDTIVDYLEGYARRTGACTRHGIDVRRVDRHRGSWKLQTSDGPYRARQVVVATGRERVPVTPE